MRSALTAYLEDFGARGGGRPAEAQARSSPSCRPACRQRVQGPAGFGAAVVARRYPTHTRSRQRGVRIFINSCCPPAQGRQCSDRELQPISPGIVGLIQVVCRRKSPRCCSYGRAREVCGARAGFFVRSSNLTLRFAESVRERLPRSQTPGPVRTSCRLIGAACLPSSSAVEIRTLSKGAYRGSKRSEQRGAQRRNPFRRQPGMLKSAALGITGGRDTLDSLSGPLAAISRRGAAAAAASCSGAWRRS